MSFTSEVTEAISDLLRIAGVAKDTEFVKEIHRKRRNNEISQVVDAIFSEVCVVPSTLLKKKAQLEEYFNDKKYKQRKTDHDELIERVRKKYFLREDEIDCKPAKESHHFAVKLIYEYFEDIRSTVIFESPRAKIDDADVQQEITTAKIV